MALEIPGECDGCMRCLDACVVTRMGGHSIASELNGLAGDGSWNCASCWGCIEVCPRGVDIFGFMMERRKREEVPELVRRGIDGIFGSGFWFGDIQFNEIRESWGLPAIRFLGREKLERLMADEGGKS